MALPADVATCSVTFGPYTDATGAVLFAGMTGKLVASSKVVDAATGAVIVNAPVTVTLGSDSTASVTVPCTTQTTTVPTSWTYTVTWDAGRFKPSPGDLTFVLPAAGTYDFDTRTPVNLPAAVVGLAVVA
jgi:hypothetical protein